MDSVRCIQKALEFSIVKHGNQKRKNENLPYIIHPVRVAGLVLLNFPFSNMVMYIAALLHDVLEDTETSYEELVNEFGKTVADLVLAVTSDKEEIRKVGKPVYLREKLSSMSFDARVLKLCDRYDNIQDLKPADSGDKHSRDYAEQTYFVFEALLDIDAVTQARPYLTLLHGIMNTLTEKGYICPWNSDRLLRI